MYESRNVVLCAAVSVLMNTIKLTIITKLLFLSTFKMSVYDKAYGNLL